jgi:hypothetical protein
MSFADAHVVVHLTESPLQLHALFTGNLSQFGEMLQETCGGVPREAKTVFAFTNTALAKLLKQLDKSQGRSTLEPREKMSIVRYALSSDPAPYAVVAAAGEEHQLDTLCGSPINIRPAGDSLFVWDVRSKAAKVLEVILPAGEEGSAARHVYVLDKVLVATTGPESFIHQE